MDRDDLLTALARVEALAKQTRELVLDTVARTDEPSRHRRVNLAAAGCWKLEEAVAFFTEALKTEE